MALGALAGDVLRMWLCSSGADGNFYRARPLRFVAFVRTEVGESLYACRLLPAATRSARLAMTMANSAGSTGLATCIRKPAASALKRSSDRPSAVRAMAGI